MKYMKNCTTNNTVWEQIKQDLEILIINGTLQNADKVPSISQLSENYKIGKSTAQKILELMYEEGTITKQRGVGYFVKPYMKEKLKSKHLDEVDRELEACICLAFKLGMNSDMFIDMVQEKISKLTKKNNAI